MLFSIVRSVHGETAEQVRSTVDVGPAERLQDCDPWRGYTRQCLTAALGFLGICSCMQGQAHPGDRGLCGEGWGTGVASHSKMGIYWFDGSNGPY